jgi:Ca2+-binding RTX toxin-like protein
MVRQVGTEFGETLIGTAKKDQIFGLGGDDELRGGGARDILIGGAGRDSVFGEDGDDVILGADDVPPIDGEDNDLIDGGAGSDWVSYQTVTAAIEIDLNNGNSILEDEAHSIQTDTLVSIENAVGSLGQTSFYGNAADNSFLGIGEFSYFHSSPGNDQYAVQNGRSLLDYSEDPAGIVLNAAKGRALDGFGGQDRFQSPSVVLGSQFDDVIIGGKRQDNLNAGSGDDQVSGGKGDDLMSGGAGDDVLDGGAGSDWLFVEFGSNLDLRLGTASGSGGELDTVANIENAMMLEAVTAIGNDQTNRFLSIGGGCTVTGGGGGDRFQTAGGNFFNADVIEDFEKGLDKIEVEQALSNLFDPGVPFLPLGTLSDEMFAIGAAADENDHFIFDPDRHALAFDLDGSGIAPAFEFLVFDNDAQIAAEDIVIVATVGAAAGSFGSADALFV